MSEFIMKSQIKFDKKFLEGIYKKLTGLVGRTPIHLMAVPGRLKNRLDLCDLSIANVEPDLDLFSDTSKTKKDTYAKKFLETLLTKDKFDFRFSWEDKKLTSMDAEIKDRLVIVGKRLDSMAIDNEDSFIDTGLKNFAFGYPLLVLPDKKDEKKTIVAPLFLWSLDIRKSNRKNEWIISKNEDSPIKMNEILMSYIENSEKLQLERLDIEDIDDGILQENEIQKYLKDILKKLNIKFDDLSLKLEPVGTKEHLEKLCSGNGFVQWSGVFGLFRSQKETIIESVLELQKNIDQFNAEDMELERFSTSSEASFDTDPSQEEIIRTLNDNEFKIIQGPPGTGKSQAISAIISNALANGAKTLVVCEKKTALDVLKHNLSEKGLDTFCIVVDDVNKDRRAVVDKARALQQYNPTKAFNEVEFERDQENFNRLRDSINASYKASSEPIFEQKTWSDLIGLFLKKSKRDAFASIRDNLEHVATGWEFNSAEFVNYCNLVKRGAETHSACKHIDITSFDLFNLDKEIDLSVSGKILIEKNIDVAVKHINKLINFIDNTILDIGTTSMYTKTDKLSKSLGICNKIKADSTNASKLLSVGKKQEFVDMIAKINNQLSIISKSCGKDIDLLPIVDKGKIQSVQHFDNAMRECLVKLSELQNKHNIITESKDNLADWIKSAGALCEDILTVARRFNCKCESMQLDENAKDKLRRLYSILDDVEDIQEAFAEGIEILGEDFNAYNSNIVTRLFSKKLSESHKYAKKVRKNYKQLLRKIDEYTTKYGDFCSYNDCESAALLSIKKEAENVSIQTKNTQNLIYEHIRSHLADIESNVNDISADLHARQKNLALELEDIQNKLKERVSEVDNLHNILNSIVAGQQIYEEVKDTVANSFNGVVAKDFDYRTTQGAKECTEKIKTKLVSLLDKLDELEIYVSWLQEYKRDVVLFDSLLLEQDDSYWEDLFQAVYYYYFLLNHAKKTKKQFLTSAKEPELASLRELFIKLQKNNTKKIFKTWYYERENAIATLDSKYGFKTLFALKRGKYAKKLSLRQIIDKEFDAFTDLFPVIMVNPIVANALLPLKQGLFNLVIFDEASQLRIEDVYTSMIRGQYKIIAGDKHQMPPSNWFAKNVDGGSVDGNDGDDDGFDLAPLDSESLLEYAEGFKNVKEFASYLDFHYRSKHPALIEFSNCAFYGCNLCPLPARIAANSPFTYYHVDGVYADRMNEKEAYKVIEIIKALPTMYPGKLPSVGIATFNVQQRNLIKLMLHEVAAEDTEFAKIYAELEQHKDPLFVKNLENIQGDERDIIIISTTYGPAHDGKFKEQFVINRDEGYRLLNVLITRAKQQLFLVTSIPEMKFADYKSRLEEKQENNRIAVFYAYLAYVKAHALGDLATVDTVLKTIKEYSYETPRRDTNSSAEGLTESPFEEEVYEELLKILPQDAIKPQYKVGGYRLDFLLKVGGKDIALECDGKAYHGSEEAFAEDMQRQKILESYGYKFYRIWSTSWFRSKDREVIKLKKFIEQESK